MKKLIFIVLFLAGLSGKAQLETYFVPETNNRWYFTWDTGDYLNSFYQSWKGGDWVSFGEADSMYLGGTWIKPDQILFGNTGTDSISTTFGTYSYNVSHGLGFTPKMIAIQAKSEDASADCWISAITATYFTITFKDTPPTDVDNAIFDWVAYK